MHSPGAGKILDTPRTKITGRITVTIPRSCGVILAALLLAATASHSQATEAPDRGAELLTPFKKDLQRALKSGLAEGPARAIQVCRIEAPGIADALSVDGVRMGRSSHKLRNTDNEAPQWVRPIMQAYLDDPSSRTPRTVALEENRWGYVEPIVVQPLCLTCHGSELAPDISAQIAELYPDDRATGFEAGDLRGVFWLEFPGEEP